MVTVAALGLVTVGAGSAQAQALPLGAVVRLDQTAPRTGEVVSGLRSVSGFAEAAEGVTAVDLYVVRHSVTAGVGDAVPVATVKPSMPLGRASFDFSWNTATTPQGLVDVIVVATTTAGRTAEARALSVQVKNVAQQVSAPARPKPAKAQATSTKAAPVAVKAKAAAPALRSAPVRAAAPTTRARRVAGPVVAQAQADQATAFYSALSTAGASSSPSLRRTALEAVETGRGAMPSIAIGMVLLLAAAHVQRAVRVQLAPR